MLSGRSAGEASKAAIELAVDEARRCPHCAREGAVSRGMARGLRRYQCNCGRTFNALTGTPLSGLHHKERWLSFGASLAERDGEGVGGTVRCGGEHGVPLAPTAFWRRRGVARGCSRASWKRTRPMCWRAARARAGRKARRRGGGEEARSLARAGAGSTVDRGGTTFSAVLPRVDAMVLTAALDPVVARDALLVSDGGASYPPCAAALGVSHESLNRSMGERVRGDLHVATAAGRTSCVTPPRRRLPLSGQLSELVPPRRPRPRRQ